MTSPKPQVQAEALQEGRQISRLGFVDAVWKQPREHAGCGGWGCELFQQQKKVPGAGGGAAGSLTLSPSSTFASAMANLQV